MKMKIRIQKGFQPFLFLLALLKYLPQLQEGMYTSVLANSLIVRQKGSCRVISASSLFNRALMEDFFFQTFCGKGTIHYYVSIYLGGIWGDEMVIFAYFQY